MVGNKGISKYSAIPVVLVVVLVAAFIAASVSNQQGPSSSASTTGQPSLLQSPIISSTKPFQDAADGFQIEAPANWTLHSIQHTESSGVVDVLTLTAPAYFSSSFAISVDMSPGTNSSSQYYHLYEAKVVQSNQGNGVTFESSSNATLSGLPAFVIIYSVHLVGAGTTQYDCPTKAYAAIREGVGFIVSFDMCNAAGQPSIFDQYLAEFDYFASGFSFLP
jgi:hypothetical protein